jgi:4-aminobutyrate aminotransferase-like enzyme
MGRSWRIAELAILLAYAMLDKRDPLATASRIARAYHSVLPLEESEIEALFPLVCLRLCTSVTLAAHQCKRAPENDYLGVTEGPAWRLLEVLDTIHPRLAWYTLREACGLEPCPSSRSVSAWLERNRDTARPLVDPDPRVAGYVLDLSVGGSEVLVEDPSDVQGFTDRIFDILRRADRSVGIGRYDEPRLLYASEQFDACGEESPERRTIHLGIDLFQPAAGPVFAPFDGTIHSFADNRFPLDYGPALILEHDADGTPFYTLYGHLSRASLEGKREGQAVAAGEKLGEIGEVDENGGWPPHLHFQLITDLLDMRGNYPGVARASQRRVWLSLVPDATALVGESTIRYGRPARDLRERRARRLGPALKLSYDRPLTIVRGRGAYLYDSDGNAYLDCVNNVCHVGHARAEVVSAAARQMRTLNTNTRYLHPTILEYARRLAAWFPEPLAVCLFVNSGSEANELALRLARSYTGRTGIVAVEAGYHGNTQGLIDVGSYKCEGATGQGPPGHVRFVPLPDPFRGRYRGSDCETGKRYASHIGEAAAGLAAAGYPPAAFLAEAWSGCGGQIVPPEGWLTAAYREARAAGAVCIADEVQTGFGRLGSHRWAFEQQGALPDIVTLGKPIGNGHPLGAVITTAEIAAAFDNGMEYFSTFGGNPVSCATGLAVLEILEREGLQRHAEQVGEALLKGLHSLAERRPLIGDVRGSGLFLGIELVRGGPPPEPAPRHASRLVERMRDHGILLSVDGPQHNVIKIKPPLVFSHSDAHQLLATLERILKEDWVELTL